MLIWLRRVFHYTQYLAVLCLPHRTVHCFTMTLRSRMFPHLTLLHLTVFTLLYFISVHFTLPYLTLPFPNIQYHPPTKSIQNHPIRPDAM